MKPALPPRTAPTTDDMPLHELLAPLSARVIPDRLMVSGNGERITEAEARAEARRAQLRPNTRRKAAHRA